MSAYRKHALLVSSSLCFALPAFAAAPLITAPIDNAVTTSLPRDLAVSMHRVTDAGALADSETLSSATLLMKRPAAAQTALDKLVHDQQDRKSPLFRKWLTPDQLRGYGPAQADVDKTVAWLKQSGLTVNSVSPSGMAIEFGGTAKAINAAFHTSMHRVTENGEAHIANMTAPAIPAALGQAVFGVTLSNFLPKPNARKVSPNFNVPNGNNPYYAVAPADFATIYNLKPLFSGTNFYGAPVTGNGVTIAVIDDSAMKEGDYQTFRKAFGLTAQYPNGSLQQVHPGCKNPGLTGDEAESAIDVEWAQAAAPNATIILASCPSEGAVFGVSTALTSLVESGTPATIISISYGGPELANGLTGVTQFASLLEEGSSEGISFFLSSGDSGVSTIRDGISYLGVAVNGLSSNPYNVTVGGTDFLDTALGRTSQYWASKNGADLASALSYVPETPWDNSCAASVVWKFHGYKNAIAACNDPKLTRIQNGVGGTGGQSIYFAKPDFQQGVPGMPNDGVRDQPDVSLFAANGIWNHFYVICMSDANEGGSPCNYKNPNDVFGNAYGGTSVASPAFAGIVGLIAETFGGARLGNIAPELYSLATAQFQNPLLLSRCNSTLGNNISSACIFNNVTVGNNAEPCYIGTEDCPKRPGATNGIGVLIVNKQAAFPATPGYNLATGLGSVNGTNLTYNFY